MAKTTNILDLNNRLEKVEKENVAQNSYTSLKNKPKINGNLLTGDKTGAQLGLAEAQDIIEINEKLNNGNIIDQTPNTTIASIATGKIPAFHDSVTYRVWVSFPFITKNSNYTITLNGVSQDNVGDVLSVATVGGKHRTGFELSVTGTYDYKKCGISLNYSITFA